MVNNWKMWCRLCAYESPSNIDINLFPPQSKFANVLSHFFSINVSDADNWGSMICLNCQEAVKRIIEFSNKVSRVQTMFLEISNGKGNIDAKLLKSQYKFDNELDQKSIEIAPVDKLYEPQINVSNNRPDAGIDLPQSSNIKIESTSDEDISNKVNTMDCNNQQDPLKNEYSTSYVLESGTGIKEPTEKPNSNELSTDLKNHKTPAVVRCPECKKMFRSLNSMRRHLKKKHGLTTRIIQSKGPFICEECGKVCKSRGGLVEHKIVHVEDRPFKCKLCEKSFKNKQRLTKHEDTHSSTSYICTMCGIRLNSKMTLNKHMVVHSDQKRHKCDYCGNEYKRAKALKTHLILHTGLRPYTCEFCNRTFAHGSNCRSHKKKSHPVELAAMEAAGKVSTYTKVPELKDLRASLLATVETQNENNNKIS